MIAGSEVVRVVLKGNEFLQAVSLLGMMEVSILLSQLSTPVGVCLHAHMRMALPCLLSPVWSVGLLLVALLRLLRSSHWCPFCMSRSFCLYHQVRISHPGFVQSAWSIRWDQISLGLIPPLELQDGTMTRLRCASFSRGGLWSQEELLNEPPFCSTAQTDPLLGRTMYSTIWSLFFWWPRKGCEGCGGSFKNWSWSTCFRWLRRGSSLTDHLCDHYIACTGKAICHVWRSAVAGWDCLRAGYLRVHWQPTRGLFVRGGSAEFLKTSVPTKARANVTRVGTVWFED